MTLENIKNEINNTVINAQKAKETKEAELTKLQERLAQILIGIDDALLNDNEEALTKLTNEKREIEEKITLYNGFLKDFNKKPLISEDKAQKLNEELLKTVRATKTDSKKQIEHIKELLKQANSEANKIYEYIRETEYISANLNGYTKRHDGYYGIAFEYKTVVQSILSSTERLIDILNK